MFARPNECLPLCAAWEECSEYVEDVWNIVHFVSVNHGATLICEYHFICHLIQRLPLAQYMNCHCIFARIFILIDLLTLFFRCAQHFFFLYLSLLPTLSIFIRDGYITDTCFSEYCRCLSHLHGIHDYQGRIEFSMNFSGADFRFCRFVKYFHHIASHKHTNTHIVR